jgi:hypothetical protein
MGYSSNDPGPPATPTAVSPTQASPKDRYELLAGMLKDYYTGLIDFEFKQGSLLALVGGWLITSDGARKFLLERPVIQAILIGFLVLLTSFHYTWVKTYKSRSERVFAQLQELGFMPIEYFESRRIYPWTMRSFIAIHGLITLTICLLILSVNLQ